MNMKITIITLFPDMFRGFLEESIIRRAQDKGAVEINIVQLRDFAVDEHGTVDDRPFGGGAGMILMAEPIIKALEDVKTAKSKVLLTSPRGKMFNQSMVQQLAQEEDIVIVAGHYEAVDERVMSHVDDEVSIGDYVLTGGELPAAVMTDAIVRLLPGVLKKDEATAEESFFEVSLAELKDIVGNDSIVSELEYKGSEHVTLLEYPHYTRPQDYNGDMVPEVLLNGNHAEIRIWKVKQAFEITKKNRPDLLK